MTDRTSADYHKSWAEAEAEPALRRIIRELREEIGTLKSALRRAKEETREARKEVARLRAEKPERVEREGVVAMAERKRAER